MEQILSELKPNSKKIVLSNFLKILMIVVIIAIILFIINLVVDFNSIKEGLAIIGINFSLGPLIKVGIYVIVIALSSFLLFGYLESNKIRYVFTKDGIKVYQNLLLVQLNELFIPYNNIVKVTFEEMPILNAGNIILELTGTKDRNMEFKFIDNPQQVAAYILKLINEYWAKYYAERSEEYKYQRILGRE